MLYSIIVCWLQLYCNSILYIEITMIFQYCIYINFVIDPAFATKLLEHAKQINDFAVAYKGKYSDSVTAAAEFYR